MKITKYEHACLDIMLRDSRLIIDPGIFAASLTNLKNISVVVITHMHGDHFDAEKVKAIVAANPGVTILGTDQVVGELDLQNTEIAHIGKPYTFGSITLEFFGQQHELFKDIQNIGVLVNNSFYYPGDSYTLPQKPVTVLAAPASAPWLRITEAKDFISNVMPQKVFPTHNALLSEIGESIHYRILSGAAQEKGIEWVVLKPSDSIEV